MYVSIQRIKENISTTNYNANSMKSQVSTETQDMEAALPYMLCI